MKHLEETSGNEVMSVVESFDHWCVSGSSFLHFTVDLPQLIDGVQESLIERLEKCGISPARTQQSLADYKRDIVSLGKDIAFGEFEKVVELGEAVTRASAR